MPADTLEASRTSLSALISEIGNDSDNETLVDSTANIFADDDLPLLQRCRDEKHASRNRSPISKNRIFNENIQNIEASNRLRRRTHQSNSQVKTSPATATSSRFISAFNNSVVNSGERYNRRLGCGTTSKNVKSLIPSSLTDDDEIVDDDDWLVSDDVSCYVQPMKKLKRNSTPLKRVDPSMDDWHDCEFPKQSSLTVASANSTQMTSSSIQAPSAFRLRVKVNERAFMFAVPER